MVSDTQKRFYTVVLAGLSIVCAGAGCRQPRSQGNGEIAHSILIAGGLDSLRTDVANEVRRQLATDVQGTSIRLISGRDIATAEMPEHLEADMPFSLAELRELGKLLRADMVVALVMERADHAVQVELSVIAPLRAAPRFLLRTSARNARELGLVLARAIRADSAYRRLRGSRN